MNYDYKTGTNPILKMDCPDVDAIFVDGAFYMISTSMHFMPGAQILKSYNLIDWEHAGFVFDTIDGTDAQKLNGDKQIYGKGMWAASLRYHEGIFYVVFVCNDTHKTYLYRSEKVEGPWKKSTIEGFYHDCSLLFDSGRAYLVHGNTRVFITELNEEMTGPKEGGLNRCVVDDTGNPALGYEGSHIYKINGRYYLFLIHSKRDRWRRVEACFSSDSLTGEFKGGDIFDDDMGFRDSGIAQGGIVEGPEGVWNAILFQDMGAVGRIPVVVPVSWQTDENGVARPVFGENGKAPVKLKLIDLNPSYKYMPLTDSDDFRYDPSLKAKEDPVGYGCFGFRSIWQFNHEPDLDLIKTEADKGKVWVKTDRIVKNIFRAKNILTQRMKFPKCAAEVTIDGSTLNDGDFAGLCAFQGEYLMTGITKKGGRLYAFTATHTDTTNDTWKLGEEPAQISRMEEIRDSNLTVRVSAVFTDESGDRDAAFGEAFINGEYKRIGEEHRLHFRLDHFTGCRHALFIMSTQETGGEAGFSDFKIL